MFIYKRGKAVEVNNGLRGVGQNRSKRASTVLAGNIVSVCYSGDFYHDEIISELVVQGEHASNLGTNDAIRFEIKIAEGNQKASAKEIGAAATVISGK